jgi:hypothetical protein
VKIITKLGKIKRGTAILYYILENYQEILITLDSRLKIM